MADEALPVIARFEVHRRSYLAPDGSVLRPLPAFAADLPTLLALYRGMVLTRAFDLKAVSLQRTGRLGTYAVSLGQEAVAVGIASAMRGAICLRALRTIFPIASPWDRRRRRPPGSLTPSSSERSRASPSACSATAPRPRATYGRR